MVGLVFKTRIYRRNLKELHKAIIEKEKDGWDCVHPFKSRINENHLTKDSWKVFYITMRKEVN